MNTFERLSFLLNPRNIYRLNPSQIDSDVVKIAIDKGLKPGGSLYTNAEYLTKFFASIPPTEGIGYYADNIDFSQFPPEAVNSIMQAIHDKDQSTFRRILRPFMVEQLDFPLNSDDINAATQLYKNTDYLSVPQSVRNNNETLVRQALSDGATAFRLRDELIKDCPSMANEIDQRVFEEVYGNIGSYIDNLGTFENRFKEMLVEKGLKQQFLYDVVLRQEHPTPAFDDLYEDNKEYTLKHYVDNAQDLSLEDLDKIKGFDNNSIEGILYSYLPTRFNPDVVNGLLGLLNNSVVSPDLRNKLIDTLLSDDNSLRVNNQLVEQLMFYRPDKVLDFLRDDINYLGDFVNAYNKNANRFNIDYTEYCDILSANNVKFDESMNYIVSRIMNDPNLLRYSLDHSLFTEEYINTCMNNCYDMPVLLSLYRHCMDNGISIEEKERIDERINTNNFDINSIVPGAAISYQVTDSNSDDVLNMLRQIKSRPDITGTVSLELDKLDQDWVIKANGILPNRINRIRTPESKFSKDVREIVNLDNYNLSTVLPNKELRYNISSESREKVFDILREIKDHPEITSNVVLRMDTVHRDWIEEATEILPNRIMVAPVKNQYSVLLSEEKAYQPDDILAKDEMIKGYLKSLDPIVSKNGNLKELSPYEKYVAAFLIATKISEYNKEDEKKYPANISRSVYDILDPDNEYMVCGGYANLDVEFLNRLGIPASFLYVEEGRHAVVAAEINDPKYGINGIYISDPTGVTYDNLNRKQYWRLNMTLDQAEKKYDLNNTFDDTVFDNLGIPNGETEERRQFLMERMHSEIPQSSVVKAMLAIEHFTDRNMEMPTENDISPNGYTLDEYNRMVASMNAGENFFSYAGGDDSDLFKYSHDLPVQTLIDILSDENSDSYLKNVSSSCISEASIKITEDLANQGIRGKVSLSTDLRRMTVQLYDEEKYDFDEYVSLSPEVEILPQTEFVVAKLVINVGNHINYGASLAENLDSIREQLQVGAEQLKNFQKTI